MGLIKVMCGLVLVQIDHILTADLLKIYVEVVSVENMFCGGFHVLIPE